MITWKSFFGMSNRFKSAIFNVGHFEFKSAMLILNAHLKRLPTATQPGVDSNFKPIYVLWQLCDVKILYYRGAQLINVNWMSINFTFFEQTFVWYFAAQGDVVNFLTFYFLKGHVLPLYPNHEETIYLWVTFNIFLEHKNIQKKKEKFGCEFLIVIDFCDLS